MSSRKKIFVVLLLVVQLGLIWPAYSFFSSVHPMILGLPLSLGWVVAMLFCSFFLLLWYYWSDPAHNHSPPADKTEPR